MTEAFAIKPCPFCGTPGKWFKTGRDVGIECGDESNCPGNAQTDTYDPEHKELAVNAWNKRVTVSEKGQCKACDGQGWTTQPDPRTHNATQVQCEPCLGTGTVSEKGEAAELLREALDAYDHIVVKTGYQGDFDTSAGRAHLARKEPK